MLKNLKTILAFSFSFAQISAFAQNVLHVEVRSGHIEEHEEMDSDAPEGLSPLSLGTITLTVQGIPVAFPAVFLPHEILEKTSFDYFPEDAEYFIHFVTQPIPLQDAAYWDTMTSIPLVKSIFETITDNLSEKVVVNPELLQAFSSPFNVNYFSENVPFGSFETIVAAANELHQEALQTFLTTIKDGVSARVKQLLMNVVFPAIRDAILDPGAEILISDKEAMTVRTCLEDENFDEST
jgi:hypothetical protein